MKRTAGTLLLGASLLVAACGSEDVEAQTDTDEGGQADVQADEPSGDSVDDEPSEDSVDDEPSEGPVADDPEDIGSAESGTTRGVVIVDGVSYDITDVQNCEPYADDIVDRQLELQGFGEHDGERLQIDVYIETLAGMPYNDVSWMGPEGVFGGPEDANVMLDSSGTSVRGNAVLFDSLTMEDTVSIEFDLEVPDDTYACR